MMEQQPQLSQAEWELVLQLLEAERQELPTEIRRTDSTSFHEELQDRKRMVEDLVARLRQTVVV